MSDGTEIYARYLQGDNGALEELVKRYGDSRDALKIEIYEQSENNVTPLTAYEFDGWFSTEHKAHYIDKNNGFVGLGVMAFNGSKYYKLLRYDGNELSEILSVEINSREYNVRAAVVGEFVYIVGNDDFKVVQLP